MRVFIKMRVDNDVIFYFFIGCLIIERRVNFILYSYNLLSVFDYFIKIYWLYKVKLF